MGLGLEPGRPRYVRALIALFLIGTSTFALMYNVQPLLVPIGAEFGHGATETSLVVSATTAGIALSVLPLAGFSSRFGRARTMLFGLAIGTVSSLITAWSPTWEVLIGARALMGVGLGAVLTSAMAWVVDHVAAMSVTTVGGLYISGTTIGGMVGRLLAGLFAEGANWRQGVLLTASLAVLAGGVAHMLLPVTRPLGARPQARQQRSADPNRYFRLRAYLVAGLGMATFVGVYNVLGYRVAGPPFGLGTAVTGLIFLTYLAGTFTSALGGRLARRYPVAAVLVVGLAVAAAGVGLTLVDSMSAIVAGLLLLSAGFFAAHSVANATAAKYSPEPTKSSAIYSLTYYAGSSLGGVFLGYLWDRGGWPLTVSGALSLLAAAGAVALGARPTEGCPKP